MREQNREGEPGELAVIYDNRDRFLGIGLYDPQSPIRVRLLHVGQPQDLDEGWWRERLHKALRLRQTLFDEATNGFRYVNGESDGWPGLVLDRYCSTLVLKLYTAAWLPLLDQVIRMIEQALQPERIVLRLSRNIQDWCKCRGLADGQILRGSRLAGPVIFLENGLHFEADVIRGQKTGFFLDQRENRWKARTLASGRRVLNTFSFSGGFSVNAIAGGAKSACDVDISAHALERARRNVELNAGKWPEERKGYECQVADVFEWFPKNRGRKFDLIVLDPPSFARRESERSAALSGYGRLFSLALGALDAGGIIVACSCSAHVSQQEFFTTLSRVAENSGRKFSELDRTGHPPDHPATFAEAQYLKALYLQF